MSAVMTIEGAASEALAGCVAVNANSKLSKAEVLLLPGWAFTEAVFTPLQQALSSLVSSYVLALPSNMGDEQAVNAWLDQLAQQLQRPLLLVGWSLGGQLAIRFAARHPDKVSALLLLACNPSFVARDDWQPAMAGDVFARFTAGLDSAPRATLRRFAGLCASKNKTLSRQLAAVQQPADAGLSGGLKALQHWDQRQQLAALSMPVQHLLAADDALVPASLFQQIQQQYATHSVELLQDCSHALPWQAAELVAHKINDLLTQQSLADMDHTVVARSFGAAADSYDAAAHLQRRVADRLAMYIDEPLVDSVALDLGCGTGYSSVRLAEQASQLIVSDLAAPMLQKARSQHAEACSKGLATDAEALALADNSVGLVFSSLAMQWTQLDKSLPECARVLASNNGRLVFSTLGPRTLYELRAAWQQVDAYEHVNRFFTAEYIAKQLQVAGFELLALEREEIVLHYPDYRAMAKELKALGAHNVNAARPGGLIGRAGLNRLLRALEHWRTTEGLPATYEVFYVVARRA